MVGYLFPLIWFCWLIQSHGSNQISHTLSRQGSPCTKTTSFRNALKKHKSSLSFFSPFSVLTKNSVTVTVILILSYLTEIRFFQCLPHSHCLPPQFLNFFSWFFLFICFPTECWCANKQFSVSFFQTSWPETLVGIIKLSHWSRERLISNVTMFRSCYPDPPFHMYTNNHPKTLCSAFFSKFIHHLIICTD